MHVNKGFCLSFINFRAGDQRTSYAPQGTARFQPPLKSLRKADNNERESLAAVAVNDGWRLPIANPCHAPSLVDSRIFERSFY